MRRGREISFLLIFSIAVAEAATLFLLYDPSAIRNLIVQPAKAASQQTAEITGIEAGADQTGAAALEKEAPAALEPQVDTRPSQQTSAAEETVVTKPQQAPNRLIAEPQQRILADAKKQVAEKVKNKSGYYEGGYPPEGEGTAPDVIARALRNAGYDLRELMYQDMLKAKNEYPFELYENTQLDKNIDFRRTTNQEVFFRRNGLVLTTDFKKGDPENLAQWLPGDFVYFSTDDDNWSETCGIISDEFSEDGVPLVIHNTADPGYVVEDNFLLKFKIVGHYRYPKP